MGNEGIYIVGEGYKSYTWNLNYQCILRVTRRLAKSRVTHEICWLFNFHMCSSYGLSWVLSPKPVVRSTILSNLHQINTKPITIKSHKIQVNKLMQLQHFLLWNKTNINVMWKTIT